ncbi:MAG: FecR family protein [Opitutaceae bacterium]
MIASRWVARRDAGLTAAEEAEFQRWLAADPRHVRAFEDFGSVWSDLARPLRTGAGDQLMQELQARVRRRTRKRISAAAVSLTILACAGVYWGQPSTGDAALTLQTASTAVVRMPARQILPDGSVVELKEGAEIAVDFNSSVRRVELRKGEAHFTVTKHPDRPFIVAAGGLLEVRAVGTAFSVQFGTSEIAVLVTEGQVAVEKPAAPPPLVAAPAASAFPGRAQILGLVEAGSRMVVALIPDAFAAPTVNAVPVQERDERLAWRAPRVEFNGTPLAEAVELLNQHVGGASGRHLVLADPSLAPMRLSGVFRADNIDSFVLLLEASFGIKAEESGKAIHLRRAAR